MVPLSSCHSTAPFLSVMIIGEETQPGDAGIVFSSSPKTCGIDPAGFVYLDTFSDTILLSDMQFSRRIGRRFERPDMPPSFIVKTWRPHHEKIDIRPDPTSRHRIIARRR